MGENGLTRSRSGFNQPDFNWKDPTTAPVDGMNAPQAVMGYSPSPYMLMFNTLTMDFSSWTVGTPLFGVIIPESNLNLDFDRKSLMDLFANCEAKTIGDRIAQKKRPFDHFETNTDATYKLVKDIAAARKSVRYLGINGERSKPLAHRTLHAHEFARAVDRKPKATTLIHYGPTPTTCDGFDMGWDIVPGKDLFFILRGVSPSQLDHMESDSKLRNAHREWVKLLAEKAKDGSLYKDREPRMIATPAKPTKSANKPTFASIPLPETESGLPQGNPETESGLPQGNMNANANAGQEMPQQQPPVGYNQPSNVGGGGDEDVVMVDQEQNNEDDDEEFADFEDFDEGTLSTFFMEGTGDLSGRLAGAGKGYSTDYEYETVLTLVPYVNKDNKPPRSMGMNEAMTDPSHQTPLTSKTFKKWVRDAKTGEVLMSNGKPLFTLEEGHVFRIGFVMQWYKSQEVVSSDEGKRKVKIRNAAEAAKMPDLEIFVDGKIDAY